MIQNLKKSGKKGFTLAELLIVVAIIAVLTAIAVPLFVGSLTKAENNVKAANIRAVRGVAVVYILNQNAPSEAGKGDGSDKDDIYEWDTGNKAWKIKESIVVRATVSSSGEVGDLEFPAESVTEETAIKQANGSYIVTVIVKQNDIQKKSA